MSDAPVVNMVIDQGSDFAAQIYWTDAGNNPFTVLHPMRMDIVSEVGTVIHSMTTGYVEGEDAGIVYNSDSGLIQFTIPAATTSLFAPGVYSYDLFVTYNDETMSQVRLKRLIKGNIYVDRRWTQSV